VRLLPLLFQRRIELPLIRLTRPAAGLAGRTRRPQDLGAGRRHQGRAQRAGHRRAGGGPGHGALRRARPGRGRAGRVRDGSQAAAARPPCRRGVDAAAVQGPGTVGGPAVLGRGPHRRRAVPQRAAAEPVPGRGAAGRPARRACGRTAPSPAWRRWTAPTSISSCRATTWPSCTSWWAWCCPTRRAMPSPGSCPSRARSGACARRRPAGTLRHRRRAGLRPVGQGALAERQLRSRMLDFEDLAPVIG
jgi:hypothetical protein